MNPVSSKTGDIDFEVDDGNGTLTNFSVTVNVGDDLNTIITAINTAFTGAGGLGAIAQESPSGYLQMNTDLVTGSTNNKQAKISVQSTSDLNVTNELGISRQDFYGREMGLLRSISTLQTALTANDAPTIRNMIDQFKFNMGELNASRSMVGLYLSNAERLNSASEDLDLKLQTDLSLKEDLDMIDATVKMNNLQVALQAAVQTTANMFSISIGNFL
jgi:flagellin-like hook-associated protein FlgL